MKIVTFGERTLSDNEVYPIGNRNTSNHAKNLSSLVYPVLENPSAFKYKIAEDQRLILAQNDEILSNQLNLLAEQNKQIIEQNKRILEACDEILEKKVSHGTDDGDFFPG